VDLPTYDKNKQVQVQQNISKKKFYMVAPFVKPLRRWIEEQRRLDIDKARQKVVNMSVSSAAPHYVNHNNSQTQSEELSLAAGSSKILAQLRGSEPTPVTSEVYPASTEDATAKVKSLLWTNNESLSLPNTTSVASTAPVPGNDFSGKSISLEALFGSKPSSIAPQPIAPHSTTIPLETLFGSQPSSFAPHHPTSIPPFLHPAVQPELTGRNLPTAPSPIPVSVGTSYQPHLHHPTPEHIPQALNMPSPLPNFSIPPPPRRFIDGTKTAHHSALLGLLRGETLTEETQESSSPKDGRPEHLAEAGSVSMSLKPMLAQAPATTNSAVHELAAEQPSSAWKISAEQEKRLLDTLKGLMAGSGK
jgi:mRNA-decapping enzyme subunit 2